MRPNLVFHNTGSKLMHHTLTLRHCKTHICHSNYPTSFHFSQIDDFNKKNYLMIDIVKIRN